MRAVIPAAGHGTRMQSVTHGGAKELLPLDGQTIIENILSEAFSVCDHAIVVWDITKGELPNGVAWVPQMPQRGLAAAIASGVSNQDTNMVFLPDAIFALTDPAVNMAQVGDVDIVLAVAEVPDQQVNKYGICEINDEGWVTNMLEKPDPTETSSRWAIQGRYRLSPKAAELLIEMVSHSPIGGPEIDMSPYFRLALNEGLTIAPSYVDQSNFRFDCGDPEGYRRAVEAYGV